MSCLYDALVTLLAQDGKTMSSRALREGLANAVASGTINGLPAATWVQWETGYSATAYSERMRSCGAWGGAIEIALFVAEYGRSVVVRTRDDREVVFPAPDPGSAVMYLAWSGNHYTAVELAPKKMLHHR